jgi:hypothetical protein
VLAELVDRAVGGDPDAAEVLGERAAVDPAVLAIYLPRLFDAGVYHPYSLYWAADDDLQRQVVAAIEAGAGSGLKLNRLLLVLAHTRGPVAAAALRRWRDHPPRGMDKLHVNAADYAYEGGWEIGPDNTRELCGQAAYALVPDGEQQPVADQTCPWCGSPLWAVLDVDTADTDVAAALAHTGWTGRLRIVTCHKCACFQTIFAEITGDGTARWSAHSHRPDYLHEGAEAPPTTRLLPDGRRPSAYLASAWNRGGSTLGGHPDWIDDAYYPACPGCRTSMHYVGLANGADLYDGEGAYYLFIHTPCQLAAVTYHQS